MSTRRVVLTLLFALMSLPIREFLDGGTMKQNCTLQTLQSLRSLNRPKTFLICARFHPIELEIGRKKVHKA